MDSTGQKTTTRSMRRNLMIGVCPLLGLATVLVLALRSNSIPQSSLIDDSQSLTPILQMTFPGAPKPAQSKLGILIRQLKETPEDNQTLAILGMTLMAHELKKAAIPCFELLASREPEEFRWHYLLGHCQMFVAPETAIAEFQQASALQPDYVPAQMMLTEVLLANGLTAEAQQRLQKEIPDSVSQHPWAAWQKSRLECMLGNFKISEELLEELRSKGIVARSLLRQLLMVKRRTSGSSEQPQLERELAACNQEFLVWECRVIQEVQAEKLDTQNVITDARSRLARRDLRGAVEVFRKAMEVDPESPELMVNLGQLWLQAGELERADDVLKLAQTVEQGSLRITLLRARIAVIKRDWSNAKELCEQAIALKPDSSEAWYVMAVMQNEQKLFDNARHSVEHALKLDPVNPDALRLSTELASH